MFLQVVYTEWSVLYRLNSNFIVSEMKIAGMFLNYYMIQLFI